MTKKEKQIYALVVLAALIITLSWVYKKKNSEEETSTQNTNQSQNQTQTGGQPNQNTPPSPSTNTQATWTGLLKTSDNSTKGSLMLVTKDHTIYLKTSRDFSKLVNSQVTATYQGTLEKFTLNDIVPAK